MDIVEEKTEENGKNKSPFTTLVKLSAGKNPTTFSLPPELKCNTIFPGEEMPLFKASFEMVYT